MCVIEGILWLSTPDVVHPCAQSKDDDGMPRVTSFYPVYFPKEKMESQDLHRPSVYAVKEQCPATLEVV